VTAGTIFQDTRTPLRLWFQAMWWMTTQKNSVAPGSVIHTDGWRGYSGIETKGYVHQITALKGKKQAASELLPRVHLVISLLKRWLMGTHQGAVSHKHLNYYLDEFTFRFNRRKSASRGKLFYRLVQQAAAVEPSTYDDIVGQVRAKLKTANPQASAAT
jgi:transposase-like protein